MKNILRLFFVTLALCTAMPSSASAKMSSLDKWTYSFCMGMLELRDSDGPASDRMMNALVYKPMEEAAATIGVSPEIFFLHPECEPRFIGGIGSPYIHLIAENPTNRLKYLEAIGRYYRDIKKQPAVWRAIINAKNTKGMTALDYSEYLIVNQKNIPIEAPGIAAFISFLCANGGTYVMFQKRCPPASEDSANGVLSRLQNRDKGRIEAAGALLRNRPNTFVPTGDR